MLSPKKLWKAALVAFVLSLVGDFLWHNVAFGEYYAKKLSEVNGNPIALGSTVPLLALLALTSLVTTHVVLGMSKNISEAMQNGALIGLVASGAVNAVNHSFFEAWDFHLALLDTSFGLVLGVIIGAVIYSFGKRS